MRRPNETNSKFNVISLGTEQQLNSFQRQQFQQPQQLLTALWCWASICAHTLSNTKEKNLAKLADWTCRLPAVTGKRKDALGCSSVQKPAKAQSLSGWLPCPVLQRKILRILFLISALNTQLIWINLGVCRGNWHVSKKASIPLKWKKPNSCNMRIRVMSLHSGDGQSYIGNNFKARPSISDSFRSNRLGAPNCFHWALFSIVVWDIVPTSCKYRTAIPDIPVCFVDPVKIMSLILPS